MSGTKRDENAIAGLRDLRQFGENFRVSQIPTAIEIGARLSLIVSQGQQSIIKITMIGVDPFGLILLQEHFAD